MPYCVRRSTYRHETLAQVHTLRRAVALELPPEALRRHRSGGEIRPILHTMVLFLIGLGLADEQDITLKGLRAVQSCSRVYLESYTSILFVDDFKARMVRF